MSKKKIAFYSGSRADYGLLEPIIEKLKNQAELFLIIGPHHFEKNLGNSKKYIKKKVLKKIYNCKAKVNYKNVDISVAVATDDGLYTPIIKSACKKRVSEISYEMKNLIDKARNNKLLPEEYNGGCFSISNLGMYGVDEFSAIINPPQAGILAVGGIKEELRKDNNDIISEKKLNLTLSVDHRIADGAVAAKLLQNLKFYLSNALGMVV
mgnify:CR=1 FL=1